MKLSIIIPVYNEEGTVAEILKRVTALNIPGVNKEVIITDDGSTDATASIISNLKSQISNLKIIYHKKNQGKGAAVRTGIKHASGDYILIQDADLEYNPKDIIRLLIPVKDKIAQVVYGTRLNRMPNFTRDEREPRFLLHYLGNKALSFITSLLYGQWITDMETCYKLFPKKSLEKIKLNSKSFDFEPEITAKLLKNGYKILEIPITTNPRGYKEGKKLNTFRDGSIALWTLMKYRFFD
ncbi:MAG: glycosyltransferase family 2 protein [Candidatus Levyibacteriota bacterium]